ncbi:folylpolyglutamate synthase/dihydrofolate synthase family protein [Bartonella sp. DGB1]|uniref:bifunctional folylpolyglutamate synthase/dihydrofolate synthase n=1 Tax=Bartonella sp. DGB1 TaxID=3239807 RepID=UPI003523786A
MVIDPLTKEITRLTKIYPLGVDLSLSRIKRLLQALDNPQEKIPPVIHIAGTNGKGSSLSFMRAMLEAKGFLVHSHSSPHLVHWQERYRIGKKGGSRFATNEEIITALRKAEIANNQQSITLFELMTVVAFLLFSENPADITLLEVGLGGKFDATNVIDKALATVITSISYDHMDKLGYDINEIAAEKAGIFKKNAPAVLAKQRYEQAKTTLQRLAQKNSLNSYSFGEDFYAFIENDKMIFQNNELLWDLPLPSLIGDHQIMNAANAIQTLLVTNLVTEREIIAKGLKNAVWPGRMQPLTHGNLVNKLPSTAQIWLDGSHNADSAIELMQTILKLNKKQPAKNILLLAMLPRKDAEGYLKEIANNKINIDLEILTIPLNKEISTDPDLLANIAINYNLKAIKQESLDAAINYLSENYKNVPMLRIIFNGSLYLVGEILEKNNTPPQ